MREQRRQAALTRLEQQCPPLLWESDWTHAAMQPNADAIEKIRTWQPGPKGLLAAGRTGRGKSRAMWALCRRLTEEGHEVAVWRAADFFFRLQELVSYGRDDAMGFVRAVAARPLLFLDDLGQQAILNSREEWAWAHFFDLLDRRLGLGHALLVTTNLGAQDMADDAGGLRADPLLRRLTELAEPVKFT